MPILDVEMVVVPDEAIPSQIALAISTAAAAIFDAPAGTVWTKFRTLPITDYAENGVSGNDVPKPVFVRVLKRELPTSGALAAEAAELAAAVATVCGRPVDNVHILYDPPGAGRVAFGGKLI
jgi:phenylpyruvate tautomerase PptA (4-oxalocrotonate tautomerase family)